MRRERERASASAHARNERKSEERERRFSFSSFCLDSLSLRSVGPKKTLQCPCRQAAAAQRAAHPVRCCARLPSARHQRVARLSSASRSSRGRELCRAQRQQQRGRAAALRKQQHRQQHRRRCWPWASRQISRGRPFGFRSVPPPRSTRWTPQSRALLRRWSDCGPDAATVRGRHT